MIFVWGKRVTRKKVGYVADFCPMCRDAQTFLLREVRRYSHIYFIPTSANELLGYERVCQGCKLALNGAPRQYVAAPRKPAHVREIIARSFPAFQELYGERMKIEESLRMAPDSLTPEVRQALIQQPFLVLSPLVEAQYGRTSVDWVIAAALAGGLGMVMLAAWLNDQLPEDYHTATLIVCSVLGLALIIWAFATVVGRFVKRQVVPRAARTLRPLKPTESEIAVALADLKRMGHRIGGVLKPRHVVDALQNS